MKNNKNHEKHEINIIENTKRCEFFYRRWALITHSQNNKDLLFIFKYFILVLKVLFWTI